MTTGPLSIHSRSPRKQHTVSHQSPTSPHLPCHPLRPSLSIQRGRTTGGGGESSRSKFARRGAAPRWISARSSRLGGLALGRGGAREAADEGACAGTAGAPPQQRRRWRSARSSRGPVYRARSCSLRQGRPSTTGRARHTGVGRHLLCSTRGRGEIAPSPSALLSLPRPQESFHEVRPHAFFPLESRNRIVFLRKNSFAFVSSKGQERKTSYEFPILRNSCVCPVNQRGPYYYLHGGLSQPKSLRCRPHRERAVLEGSHRVGIMGRAGRDYMERAAAAAASSSPTRSTRAGAAAPKTTLLNPSGRRRFLSSLQQSNSIAIGGDKLSMAAPTVAAPLDEGTAKKVLRQVEFYFSDSNLPRDKFLRETVEQSDDGLVSLPLICSFSRMKSHLGLDANVKAETLPEETVLAVAEVLRRSAVLRVSEDGKKIGRASELLKPDEIIEQVDSRTVAVSPLPYNVKQEDVQSFFTNYAKVNSVRLPRNIANKKHFCGTALVEFSEEEEAKSITNNALVFAGANLEIRPKKEFDAEQESKKEAYEKAHPRKDNQDEGYPKGLIVAFKLKKTTVDSVVQQDNTDEGNDSATKLEVSSSMEKLSGQGPESTLESDGTKEGKSSDDMTKEEELNTGEATESEKCIGDAPVESDKHGDGESLSRDGKTISGNVNVKDQISREDLKETFKKFGTVRYVDFSIGDNSGYLRFEDSQAAEKARMSAALADEGGLIIKDHIVTLEPVTGEAEKDYWNTIRGIQGKYKDTRSYKGRALKNQRGGKHFNGKRDRNPESEKNSNKAQKVEAAA